MKKILVAAAAAAMLASVSFAEDGITFGSWGRAVWVSAATQGDNIITGATQFNGGASPRTALSVHGSSENMGYDLDIFCNGETLGTGDHAQIWWSPISQVKAYLGKVDVGELQGDAVYGLWNFVRIGAVVDEEGWTFFNQGRNVLLNLKPIEGLNIYGGFNLAGYDEAAAYTLKDAVGLYGRYAMAYTIADVGTIKVGFDCDSNKKAFDIDEDAGTAKPAEHWGTVAAAFDLTAVENLFFSIGAFIPTNAGYTEFNDTTYAATKNVYKVNANARYTMDALTFHVRAGTKLAAYDQAETIKKGKLVDDAIGFLVGGAVEYKLDSVSDALANSAVFVEADYADGIYRNSTSADDSDTFTFGVGFTKGYSNGTFGIAFEGTTNNAGSYDMEKADDFAWMIPVMFGYSF